ncbi:SLATT domain-containing protein [Lysinibacillus sphaericus]|uniref:SLATT domain-containing protein n=1 Tax=Lysinibacillus sphaericus TaxID=1421 RepID=UPI001A9DF98C|nr:SLATT domain-containing protein [Lysinibacillus sphaericus]QTB29078.1 SLATT domain-containing protein [Lysinibacillus sphaericus]
MDRNSQDSQGYKLESQIREAYGRLVYTYTCHNKIVQRLLTQNNNLKVMQIVLSALTTGSFLTSIITHEKAVSIIGAIISVTLLILNAYTKNFDLVETAQSHQKAADALWVIREDYVSLLTDFEILEMKDIMTRRDELQNRTAEVYAQSPRTDGKSYKAAQKALKNDEEQTFSEQEIDFMLPNSIRRSNRTIK